MERLPKNASSTRTAQELFADHVRESILRDETQKAIYASCFSLLALKGQFISKEESSLKPIIGTRDEQKKSKYLVLRSSGEIDGVMRSVEQVFPAKKGNAYDSPYFSIVFEPLTTTDQEAKIPLEINVFPTGCLPSEGSQFSGTLPTDLLTALHNELAAMIEMLPEVQGTLAIREKALEKPLFEIHYDTTKERYCFTIGDNVLQSDIAQDPEVPEYFKMLLQTVSSREVMQSFYGDIKRLFIIMLFSVSDGQFEAMTDNIRKMDKIYKNLCGVQEDYSHAENELHYLDLLLLNYSSILSFRIDLEHDGANSFFCHGASILRCIVQKVMDGTLPLDEETKVFIQRVRKMNLFSPRYSIELEQKLSGLTRWDSSRRSLNLQFYFDRLKQLTISEFLSDEVRKNPSFSI